MSACFGCYFHKTGYLYNACLYFESECYFEPESCKAFSGDGNIDPDVEDEIYRETDGNFGKKKAN